MKSRWEDKREWGETGRNRIILNQRERARKERADLKRHIEKSDGEREESRCREREDEHCAPLILPGSLSLPLLGLTLASTKQRYVCERLVRTMFCHTSLPNLVEHALAFPRSGTASSLGDSFFFCCASYKPHLQSYGHTNFPVLALLLSCLQMMLDSELLSAGNKGTCAKRSNICPCPGFDKGEIMLICGILCQLLRGS